MKGFKSTSTTPYTYTQSGVWKKGQYTFQAVVLSDSGYTFAFQRSDTTWQTVDLSWQVKDGSYSKIQWTFALEVDAVAFKLIANTVTGETTVLQPMLEKGTNGSTPIAHEEDLRGMDGDDHEFIFTRNTTGIAPDTPLSTQDDDYVPEDWTDNAQGVTPEIPFEFVSMRERKNGVWLDFSPPSLWAKWGEDGLSVNLLVEGHYKSHWEGITKVVEIVGGVDVGGNEVVKVSAVFRKGEENIAATVSQSRGFQWYVNGVHLTSFDNQPFITLDETYGDGFADYVVLSYLVNSIREEERREIINISEGMDGIGEEFIFKANNSDTTPPVLPQTTDANYQDDDYYGQGTANEWDDDPVAPTELNQFVWVAKRKKVGGVWEAFGTPSVWTKWVTDGEDGKDAVAPIIINGHWAFWDETIQDYVESAFSAIGDDGHSPYVDENTGTWWEWNDANGAYQDTGVTAKGEDGADGAGIASVTDYYATSTSDTTPPSTWYTTMPVKSANEYLWNYEVITYTDGRTPTETQKRVIQGKDARSIYDIKNAYAYSSSDTVSPTGGWQWSLSALGAKPAGYFLWVREDIAYTDNPSNYFSTIGYVVRDGASGADGADGADGHSPYISGTTGTWWTWNDATGQYENTGYSPVGSDGAIPYPAGYYDQYTQYVRTATTAPYVQNGGVYYLLKQTPPSAGYHTSNTTYWEAFDGFSAIYTDILLANFAKLNSAVFSQSSMFSQNGITAAGVPTSNYEMAGFIPNIKLDFVSGLIEISKNIKFGRKDGHSVLEYYDNDGNLLYDLGPNGLHYISFVPEAWLPVTDLVYLGTNMTTILTNKAYKTAASASTTTYYRYRAQVTAGVKNDPTNSDGLLFESPSTSGVKVDNKIFCQKTPPAQYISGGTNARIYPPDIHVSNEAVYDTDPIYFMQLYGYIQGNGQSVEKAYWNG